MTQLPRYVAIGPNQTEVRRVDGTTVLLSYGTPVAAYVPGTGYLRTDHTYSRTTSRHINRWLPCDASKVPTTTPEHLLALVDGTVQR